MKEVSFNLQFAKMIQLRELYWKASNDYNDKLIHDVYFVSNCYKNRIYMIYLKKYG